MTTLILLSAWYIWQNNRHTDLPSQTEIKQHFNRSVNWLNLNYSSIEGIQNRRVDILPVAEVRAMDTLLFPSLALFDPKSAKLTEAGQAFLEEQRLNSKALFDSAFYVEIVGHADSKGNAEDNIVLSKQRANTVRDYLVSKGLDDSIVETKGIGDTMPIADNGTAEGRAKNRRVEILVLGRLKE